MFNTPDGVLYKEADPKEVAFYNAIASGAPPPPEGHPSTVTRGAQRGLRGGRGGGAAGPHAESHPLQPYIAHFFCVETIHGSAPGPP